MCHVISYHHLHTVPPPALFVQNSTTFFPPPSTTPPNHHAATKYSNFKPLPSYTFHARILIKFPIKKTSK